MEKKCLTYFLLQTLCRDHGHDRVNLKKIGNV